MDDLHDVVCPHCGCTLSAPADMEGEVARCEGCRMHFRCHVETAPATVQEPSPQASSRKAALRVIIPLTILGLCLLTAMGIWLDSFRTKAFTTADGAYRGQAILHIPHGQGKLTRSEADVYEGAFSWGQPHGAGIWQFGDMQIEGQWTHGGSPSTGHVVLTSDDGSQATYDGELSGTAVTGHGRWVADDGYREGTFVDRQLREGELYDATTGETFSGTFGADGYLVRGKRTCADGSSVEGPFKAGLSHGRCVLRLISGDRIEGNWKEGQVQPGYLYIWKDGTTYTGTYDESDRPHGQGKKTTPDGTTYVGVFNHGRIHGAGILTSKDGAEYRGIWENGIILVPDYQVEVRLLQVQLVAIDTYAKAQADPTAAFGEICRRFQLLDATRCPQEIKRKTQSLKDAIVNFQNQSQTQPTFGESMVLGFVGGLMGDPTAGYNYTVNKQAAFQIAYNRVLVAGRDLGEEIDRFLAAAPAP